MKIALDTQSTLGQKTGIGHYTAELLRALQRVAPQHEYVSLDWQQDPPMRLNRRLYWQQWELPQRTRKAKTDLLHVTGFDAPRIKPCPVVLTVHDLIGALYPQHFPHIARFYWSRWLPYSIRWADVVIADSQNTRGDILRLTGIPASKVHVVPLGIPQRYSALIPLKERERVQRQYRLPKKFILYTGTIEPRKGLDTLVAAFGQIAASYPHTLIIAGKVGWYGESLKTQIASLELNERVQTIGYIPDDDLPALYASAEVFVFPSRYEGFGLPPLEAMACGTPVVCSNASSLPEVTGDAAILTPPDYPEALAAALRRVLENARLRATLREQGLQRARAFTWDETARQTLRVYEQVVRQ